MAKKEELSAGLANLLAGGTAAPTITQEEEQLINTFEDEATRQELEQRLRQKRLVGRGRPRKNDIQGRRSDGYGRTSLIVNQSKYRKLQELALRETLTTKEVVEFAFDLLIQRYEAKHGELTITDRPTKTLNDLV